MKHVYSNGKIFHFPEKLHACERGILSAPIHVRLKPTNRCPHRCAYCCYRNKALSLSELMNEQDEMAWPKLREILADFAAMGVRAVTFSGGGEPLCYPHFTDAVRRLHDSGISVAALTNGALLDGERADILARHAVWVRISMDAADAETYAQIRGVPAREFDRVCSNIRSFAGRPDRRAVLGVNFIISRENSASVLDFLRLAKNMGVDHVKVSPVVVGSSPGENADYLRPLYETVKASIQKASDTLADAHFAVIDKFHMPEQEQESYERTYTRCPMVECLTVIAADLNVYTCQDKAYTRAGLLGSLKEQTFASLWNSEAVKARLQALNPSRDCRHHCVAHVKNLMLLDYLKTDQEHVDFV